MGEFRTVEIDLEVHKKLKLERRIFAETPNSVLRRLLRIDSEQPVSSLVVGRPWAGKGVVLPHGTEIQMDYNGRVHTGVIDNGDWTVEGKRYNSPSAAAGGVALTKNGARTSLDGWVYWNVRRPSDAAWVPLASLRPRRGTQSSSDNLNGEEADSMPLGQTNVADLPTENSVIAELEDYLAGLQRPIGPSDAYRALADRFGLTPGQRHRMMPNSDEVHWENRVRQARRKLVNAGKIDPDLPRGLWALKPRS